MSGDLSLSHWDEFSLNFLLRDLFVTWTRKEKSFPLHNSLLNRVNRILHVPLEFFDVTCQISFPNKPSSYTLTVSSLYTPFYLDSFVNGLVWFTLWLTCPVALTIEWRQGPDSPPSRPGFDTRSGHSASSGLCDPWSMEVHFTSISRVWNIIGVHNLDSQF